MRYLSIGTGIETCTQLWHNDGPASTTLPRRFARVGICGYGVPGWKGDSLNLGGSLELGHLVINLQTPPPPASQRPGWGPRTGRRGQGRPSSLPFNTPCPNNGRRRHINLDHRSLQWAVLVRCCTNVGRHLRRRPNVRPELGECAAFAGLIKRRLRWH